MADQNLKEQSSASTDFAESKASNDFAEDEASKLLESRIKDFSFETTSRLTLGPDSAKNAEIGIKVQVSAQKLSAKDGSAPDIHEVSFKLGAKAGPKEGQEGPTLFNLELDYARTYYINPKIMGEDLDYYLHVKCAEDMLPTIKHIILYNTRNSGYEPLDLDLIPHINPERMYKDHVARRKASLAGASQA